MSSRNKCPGSARQRASGADWEIEMCHNSQSQTYATCADLQRRHLMRRCGVGSSQASLIAALCFGEDRR
jgi:hypothetical protein